MPTTPHPITIIRRIVDLDNPAEYIAHNAQAIAALLHAIDAHDVEDALARRRARRLEYLAATADAFNVDPVT